MTWTTLIFFIFIGISVQQDGDCFSMNPTCLNLISNIALKKNFTAIPPLTLLYSGLSINNLGHYDECIELNEYNYILMRTSLPGTLMSNGFCLPSYCSADDLNKCSAIINYELGTELTKILKADVVGKVFTSFSDPTQKPTTIGASSVGFIVFISLLFSIQVLSSFSEKIFPSKPIAKDTKTIFPDQEDLQTRLLDDKTKKEPLMKEIMKCLDIVENVKLIFHFPESMKKSPLRVFNGVRFFAMIWVILGHEYFVRAATGSNMYELTELVDQVGFVNFILSGLYSVDMFFWIGGFFSSYALVGRIKKMGMNPLKYIVLFVHRFLRIWPAYAFCIFFLMTLFATFATGPVAQDIYGMPNLCAGEFWKNLLFLDNVLNPELGVNYCYGWGWYLSCDMQMFLITPILIAIYCKNKKAGYISMVLTIIVVWIITLILALSYNLTADIPYLSIEPTDESTIYYIKPYTRADPYILGMIIGCIYLEFKDKEDNPIEKFYSTSPLLKRLLTYMLGCGITIGLIFLIVPLQRHPYEFSTAENVLHLVFSRFVFTFGISVVLIPAIFTNKCYILDFLGSYFFVPLGRLSFCIYLVHFLIILYGTSVMKSTIYVKHWNFIYLAISDLIYATFFAFIVSVFIENPAMKLQKLFLEPSATKK